MNGHRMVNYSSHSQFFSLLFGMAFTLMCSNALALPVTTSAVATQAAENAADIPQHENGDNGTNHANLPKNENWQTLPKANLQSQVAPVFDSQTVEHDEQNAKCGYWDCLPLEPLQNRIYYTVTQPMTVSQQAAKWGVTKNVLLALNPSLDPQGNVEVGQKLLVENRLDSAPAPYSRGRANRGKLKNARLMPEGEGYFLRTIRNRSWGADTTIQAMMTTFKAYAETYPDAPDINVGDISKRRGGKISPHASHQSGRDIDIGFVHHTGSESKRHPEHFIRADSKNLDVEKTWFITKTLIRTGLVQVIYLDKFVQRKLWAYASKELTKEQQELIFSIPKHENSSSAILQHWPGHRNHFHIRFKCPTGQYSCKK